MTTTLPRNMPSLGRVAQHWATSADTLTALPNLKSHWIGWGEPFCFACGWLAPVPDGPSAWMNPRLGGWWLDRAHLHDHWGGGGGESANLVPLCLLCHQAMPPFYSRVDALRWVDAAESTMPRPTVWQMFTDSTHHRGSNSLSRLARMLRLRGDYLTFLLTVDQAPAR